MSVANSCEDQWDKHYYTLTSISLSLRSASPVQVPLHLFQAQNRINELWKINFGLIEKKSGWIRGRVNGGEYNYSSRAVIILDPTLPIDMVDVPYRQFLELFKEVIERKIQEDRGWSLTKTKNYLSNKFVYDDYVYSIMQRVLKEESPSILLNRNPTLTYGSILLMKIRNVKKDPDDMTLAIGSSILPGLNADSMITHSSSGSV